MVKSQISKLEALTEIAEYVLDDKERYDYVYYCEENSLDPNNIQGAEQRTQVYALALIGLGLKFI
jgi:hypothetical protein